MLDKDAVPNAHTIPKSVSNSFFNLVVRTLDDKRIREDGLRLLDLMESHGLSAATATQNRFLLAWGNLLPESMLHRFVKMRSDGKHLSIWAYRYIVVAYEWSDPSFALTIFGEMELLGYKADRAAYNAVLVACCQLGKYEEAHHWFMHMADRALEPNAKSYGTMVKVYSSNSEHEEALELFETMRRRCFRPDRFAYHHAIRSCIELQRITYAVELFEDAVKANMTLCVCTYVALISACRQLGHSKLADKVSQCWRLTKQGDAEHSLPQTHCEVEGATADESAR